jgi:hypothetical protein
MRFLVPLIATLVLAVPAIASDAEKIAEMKLTIGTLKAAVQRLEAQVAALEKGSASTGVVPSTDAPRYVVNPSAVQSTRMQCQATTKKGTQCSRIADPGKSYCWQHGGR